IVEGRNSINSRIQSIETIITVLDGQITLRHSGKSAYLSPSLSAVVEVPLAARDISSDVLTLLIVTSHAVVDGQLVDLSQLDGASRRGHGSTAIRSLAHVDGQVTGVVAIPIGDGRGTGGKLHHIDVGAAVVIHLGQQG